MAASDKANGVRSPGALGDLPTAARQYQRAEQVMKKVRMFLYAEVRKAHDEGMSYGNIAHVTGISRSRVQQIVEEGRS